MLQVLYVDVGELLHAGDELSTIVGGLLNCIDGWVMMICGISSTSLDLLLWSKPGSECMDFL